MSPADDPCADMVEAGDPLRHRAALAAPATARPALFALYAFNVEISRAPYLTAEPMIAEMRLQWWRDTLAEIASGAAPRAHEVAAPLAEAIRAHDLPIARLDAMAAARSWDCWREPHAGPDALQDYLRETGGGLMVLAGRVLGGEARHDDLLEAAGEAGATAAWLAALARLRGAGRVPLPPDTGVADVARMGLSALARARAARLPESLLPALLPAASAGLVLRRALAAPERAEAGALSPSEARLRWEWLRAGLTGRI